MFAVEIDSQYVITCVWWRGTTNVVPCLGGALVGMVPASLERREPFVGCVRQWCAENLLFHFVSFELHTDVTHYTMPLCSFEFKISTFRLHTQNR